MQKYGSCTYCGKIDHLTNGLCNECYDVEQKNIHEVIEFLLKHPNSHAMEVSLNTGISIEKITRLIKRGTLVL